MVRLDPFSAFLNSIPSCDFSACVKAFFLGGLFTGFLQEGLPLDNSAELSRKPVMAAASNVGLGSSQFL